MSREEVIAKLKSAEPALRAIGVAGLYLFGSHARDQAGPGSDIDVFVDPAPGTEFGFLPFMEAYETIQQAVGENLDYGTRKGLHPMLRRVIEREAVQIF
jgi:uncharacterized protein